MCVHAPIFKSRVPVSEYFRPVVTMCSIHIMNYLVSLAAILLSFCAGYLSSSASCSSSGMRPNSSHFCTPGFDGKNCKSCSATFYRGLLRCDGQSAYIIPGYWVGECENGTLCTGTCPFGFCSYNGSTDYMLPGNVSELDEYVCGDTRTGVLCGECRSGYSVSYHSHTYACASNDSCKYGWLLYIVSELFPLTVVFIVVMAFNINFTSGAVNSFILFGQLQDSLTVFGDGVIHQPSITFYFVFYELIYRCFNLDYFSIEMLSFCLWKGATVLDTLAFKYVTIVSCLALMLICVFIVNSTKAKKCFSCLRPTTLKSSLIHGLTVFFVMCYSQSARVSFRILEPAVLTSKCESYVKTVVFRSGQLTIFEPAYLIRAIPAIFFALVMLVLPPFVLIMFPLFGKCLALCNLSESKLANCISRVISIQLLDSFQGSFRNEVRFFSGFYFLYRVFPLLAYYLTRSEADFNITLILFFICILAIHAVVQPYKNRMHNVIDLLLFVNLAVISALTFVNYNRRVQGYRNSPSALSIQLILIYSPLVCLLVVGLFKFLKSLVKFFKKSGLLRRDGYVMLTDTCSLPPLREE